MGGRGSFTSRAQFYETARRRLRQAAESASEGRSYSARMYGRMARAAEGLVGTERGRELVNDNDLRRIERELIKEKGNSAQPLGRLENQYLQPGTGERPLNYSIAQWTEAKSVVQQAVKNLKAKGYSVDEIAAAIQFKRYIYLGR